MAAISTQRIVSEEPVMGNGFPLLRDESFKNKKATFDLINCRYPRQALAIKTKSRYSKKLIQKYLYWNS